MPTSFESFTEETRELAMLDDVRPTPSATWPRALAILFGFLGGFAAIAVLL